MLGYTLLSGLPNISHFVTTRHGGYSAGKFEGFNCSPYCGDKLEDVARNQELLLGSLIHLPKALVIPQQIHKTDICIVDQSFIAYSEKEQKDMLYGIDAIISDQPGYCICVSTADCVPVLIYDATHNIVAAVHAGWRGTANKIVSSVLKTMNELHGTSGKDIYAGIGPSISQNAFEVGDEVYNAFKQEGFNMQLISMRHPETNKWHIDLWEANKWLLQEYDVPVSHIECAGICTYEHYNDFFSARRLGIESGRILSGIMINP